VAIASGTGAMTRERVADLVCAGFPESLTVAVMLKVPLVAGVPVIIPVAAVRVRPLGRLPAVIDQL